MSPIIVFGTGRSGTSTVAWTLHNAGVYMGDITRDDTEDPHIRDINLRRIRGQLTPQRWAQAIRARESNQSPWGFKDPAASYFLPELQAIFPDATFIQCVRPRPQVVESLIRNYGFEPDFAEAFHDGRVASIIASGVKRTVLQFSEICDGSFLSKLPVACSRSEPANLTAEVAA